MEDQRNEAQTGRVELMRILAYAQTLVESFITEGAVAIDATAGNGNDTLFLAQRCARVYAFDVQEKALENTTRLLEAYGLKNAKIILDSHENLSKHVKEDVDIVMFNLGYLPGGDKQITTRAETTVDTIKTVLGILKAGGLISITVYPGHNEGKKEANLLEAFTKKLSPEHHTVLKYQFLNRNQAPYNLFIAKH